MPFPFAAQADPPAGGAALDQVLIATGGAVAVTIALLALCAGHRSGRVGILAFGDRTSRALTGLPGWAGVPSAIALVTLLPALFGLQWDESIHIAQGRDEGPLANPSHYLLLGGIFGAFAAGVISITMGDRSVPRSGVRVADAWTAPIGGLLTAAGAAVALLGFPLDDVWHRVFGQDVTLWSPTHVAMIAGLSLSVVGVVMLTIEGMRARTPTPRLAGAVGTPLLWLQRVMVPASLLLLLSLLQGEFDFGVPQFRLLLHPMIVMGAAGVALVAARVFFGRGAALGAAIAFVVIRGAVALIVGPGLGQPDHVFPLYLAEAAVVELVALRISPRRALRFGVACGLLIGTVGLAAEWAWSNVFTIPWPAELLPEGVVLGLAMALAGSVLGAWLGAHLTVDRFPRTPALRHAAIAACAAVTAMVGYGLVEPEPGRVRANVTLFEVAPPPERTVHATVRLDPPDAAEGADWLRTISWQGGGLQSDELRELEPGVFRTTRPIPVHGTWKTAIRLAHGGRLSGLPVFLPADDAIPAAELPAPPRFTRSFTDEAVVLRREAKEAPGWLWTGGTGLVAAVLFALLGVWALALRRLADAAPEPAGPREPAPSAGATPARVGVTA